MPDNAAYAGQASLFNAGNDFAIMDFVARMVASDMATVTLVTVVAVQNVGDVEPVGLIDVKPMVAMLDGKGQPVAHGVIHNVPYLRLQGGVNAVIIDPVEGDIGIAVFGSRDLSSVKATKAAANPGSRRQFDWSDALYIGGVLNGTPTRYIRFKADGDIELKPATKVIVTGDLEVSGAVAVGAELDVTGATTLGAGLDVTGDAAVSESLTVTGEVTGNGKALSTHTHGGVTTGGGTSGPPS